MNIESFREYCLSLDATSESFPFGPEVLVFKVKDKMFATLSMEPPFSTNLKCEPELAITLRDEYEEIAPGYHMNKKHWNTVSLEGRISDKMIRSLIDHSYERVILGMKKSEKETLLAILEQKRNKSL